RRAYTAIATTPGIASMKAITAAIRGASHLHGKLDALSLTETLGKWPVLELLLSVAQSAEWELTGRACELLRRWVGTANRRFTAPTPAQISEITRLLEQSFGGLSDDLRKQVKGYLDPWVAGNR